MNESKQRRLGVIISYFTIVLNTLIQLIYTPFLIRMLGQSEYGLYSLVVSIIGSLSILDFGFGNAIIVYASKYMAQGKKQEENKLYGMFKIIFILMGIIVAILGFILFLYSDKIFTNSMNSNELHKIKIMILILSFNLMITFVFNIYSSIISAYEKFTFQKVMSIISILLKPMMMLPLLFLGFKSITMSVVITIVNIIVVLSNYLYCRNKLNIKIKYMGIDKTLLKIILGYSIWIFLGYIVNQVNWSVDNFILGIVSGTTAVSVYAVAANFNTLFINLSTAISNVMLPKMAKLVANDEKMDKITDEFIKVGRLQFYIMFLVTTGFILFGKNFIIIWAGPEYSDSYYVALLLVVPAFFSLIQNLGLSIMQAKNKYQFKAISNMIMSIVNVIISIFLAKKFGAIGAAFGTSITLILCNTILINIYYYKVIKIDVVKFWKDIIKIAIPYLIPICMTVLVLKLSSLNGISQLLILIPIYTGIYAFISYFFNMNDYEKNIVNKLLKKLNVSKNTKILGDK